MEATLHRSHRIHPGFPFTSLWRGFKRFFTVLNRALEAQSTYTRLSSLNEAELARLGMTREDVTVHIAQKYF